MIKNRKCNIDIILCSIVYIQNLPIVSVMSFKLILPPHPQSRIQSRITHHINCHVSLGFFNLKDFRSLPLFILSLTFLKRVGQLFYKMFLTVGLSDIFSLWDSSYAFLPEIPQKWFCILLRVHLISTSFLIGIILLKIFIMWGNIPQKPFYLVMRVNNFHIPPLP